MDMAMMASKIIECPFPYFPIPYGCWCGLTPDGTTADPIDNFDTLCKKHDQCYDEGIKEGCNSLDEYLVPYKYTIKNKEVKRDQILKILLIINHIDIIVDYLLG